IITTTFLAILAFFEVGFNNIPVTINLMLNHFMFYEILDLIHSTVSMLLPVLIVSTLVHIYSISYMS
ncbi:hypothetical protein ASPBRDRAFT_96545, partial [Aspergillus brasiliensis CBS 101740]